MFHQFYRLEAVLECPERKPSIPVTESQTCRFCGKRSPEVIFNSDAHVFPEALGNHTLVSEFECDRCNNIFSDYESHLV
ncbi:HNH endonuclease, partial [Acinetobacter baumannii]|uniref:HNH endonuclease n=1 Tax=Acinetobacter baumannii TaxID=470 RepID=UPI00331F40CD